MVIRVKKYCQTCNMILNPTHLCSSMANTIVINQSKKEIGRCVRQKRIRYTADDLKQAKGDIFLTETFHKEFIKMKSNEISKHCFGCNFSYQDSVNRWKNKTWDAKEFETQEALIFGTDVEQYNEGLTKVRPLKDKS